MVLSVAAGWRISAFEAAFSESTPVVRAVPNTPAAIGKGITIACANGSVAAEQRKLAGSLLTCVGEMAWLEDEDKMDAVTAVSGSGPAYAFLLIESLAAAAEAQGLDPALSMQLSESVAQLRKNVTSPAGTTEAALKILMADGGLPDLMAEAVAAAVKRSRELG